MYKPFQPPVSPRNQQHHFINSMPKTSPNRILIASPPPAKIITQPHRISNSPPQQYMIHLVPQQPLQIARPNINSSSNIFRPENSIGNKFSDKKTSPLTQSILSVERPQTAINSPNLGSTAIRSRGVSQVSNKQSKLTTERNQYLLPQSPNNLRRMEPVRRVSQHRLNISSDDKRLQEQNIKIVIETNSTSSQINTPSRIIIEHSQNNQKQGKNGPFIISTSPQAAQTVPIQVIQHQKIIPMYQNNLEKTMNIINNGNTNQQSCFKPKANKIEQRQENRAYSYSMDSKEVIKKTYNVASKIQMKPNSKLKEQTQPQIVVIDPPSELYVDKKPTSLSVQQNQQLRQSKRSLKHSQKHNKRKEREFFQQISSKNQKKELSIQSSKANRQDKRKIKKDVYHQYYDQSGFQSYNSSKASHQRKHYLIYQSQRALFASTLLLNQIYENQVNKALLKMNVVQNKSREKSIKRRDL